MKKCHDVTSQYLFQPLKHLYFALTQYTFFVLNISPYIYSINKQMNRIFGYLKQKIAEVKQQNKQQIQALTSAISQNQYSTEKVLTLLQSMKASYMNWNILIANEASTGLYYSQLHNRNICLRKIKGNKDIKKHLDKNKMKLSHIKDTAEEIKEISQLTEKWSTSVNTQIQGINQCLNIMKKVAKKRQNVESLSQQYISNPTEPKSPQNIKKSSSKSIDFSPKQSSTPQQKMQQILDDDIQT